MIIDFGKLKPGIDTLLDECYVDLPIGYNRQNEIINNSVFCYSILYDTYTKTYTKKYYLLSNLKFSHGGGSSSTFRCVNIKENAKILVGKYLKNVIKEIARESIINEILE